MGLFQKAVETYDNMAHLAGVSKENRVPLLPISHIMQKAQIEITLDRDGHFITACEVPIEDCKTIIPATEASAGRTSRPEAHPLSDQLDYLLPFHEEKHSAFLSGLDAWAASVYAHPKVTAVRAYIRSGSMADDLSHVGLIQLRPDGSLEKGKLAGTDYAKCLVRWKVLGTGEKDAAWEDLSLMRAYIAYYEQLLHGGKQDLCMISGNLGTVTPNHPKGITAANYGAKLISANDASGFTFRGRFVDAQQASTVGYIASQKAHNALQWIAANEGVVVGGRTFLCWNPNGLHVQRAITPLSFGKKDAALKPTEYRNELQKTLSGLRNELPAEESVVVCAFDAATTGRLALTYYAELLSSDFYDRLENWYGTCCWENGPFGTQSPPGYKIVDFAFGVERSSGKIELDDKLRREQIQRILSCIIDRAGIPADIVTALVKKASAPQSYKNEHTWRNLVFTACALISKFETDKKGGNPMSWTLEDPDRSFQFGRLLAAMERIEADYYSITGEERQTNAIKRMSQFRQHPWTVYEQITQTLRTAYLPRVKPWMRVRYESLKDEIIDKIRRSDTPLDAPLTSLYLLGYDMQHSEFFRTKKEEKPNEHTEA